MVTPDPRRGRFDVAARRLGEAAVATAVLAAGAVLLPDPAGAVLAVAALALVGLTPVARLVWLGGRWLRRGDRRFGWIPFAILSVVVVGFVVASR